VTQPEIISTYEAISVLTGHMLDAAQRSDWDHLTLLERDCRGHARRLMDQEPKGPLSKDLQQRKLVLITKILSDDASIRALTEPRMAELDFLLQSAGRGRKLRQAYRSESK
jgi:flagellar protein FliT